MTFCVKLLKLASGKMWVDGDSLYIWRHRNDQIHLPALCQKSVDTAAVNFWMPMINVCILLNRKIKTFVLHWTII